MASDAPVPFKNWFDAALYRRLADLVTEIEPRFDRARFLALTLDGLDARELMDRMRQTAVGLHAALPGPYSAQLAVLRTLAPRIGHGFVTLSLGEFVARHGLDDPARSLDMLRFLTPLGSSEFAVRPFLQRDLTGTLATLLAWARDPDEHVRRLASEGSRPRLPWGLRLTELVRDPSPTLPILELLKTDPALYVRKSVANHLNDIAKDHPAVIADWLQRHLPEASVERRTLLRHASRSLIKAGDAAVLAAWGQGEALLGRADLAVAPAQITLGEGVRLSATLTSLSRRPQALVVDVVIHHVKANGSTSPKVFKGWNLTLAPGETRTLAKQHAVRPITTRVYHPGAHRVDLQVNGAVVASAVFELRVPGGFTPATGRSAPG